MGSSNPLKPISKALSYSAFGSNFLGTGRSIISSKGGIDTVINRPVTQAKKQAEKAEQDAAKRQAQQAASLAEEKKKTAIANESVRKQKEKARRRTIFAGQNMEENIFRKILGS
jgi:hypothetical protein